MTPAERRGVELSRVRFRRAVTLVLMTLVLPGSAQLVAGRKDIGRLAIRVVLAGLGAVGVGRAGRTGVAGLHLLAAQQHVSATESG